MNAIRLRAVIVAVVFSLGLTVFIPVNNALLHNVAATGGHFPLAPFFIALWLLVGVAAWSRLTGKAPVLSGTEILAIWVCMVLAAGVAWSGLSRTFLINITAPALFAGDGYTWTGVIEPFIPGQWSPAAPDPPDPPDLAQTLYNGLPDGREMSVLHVWQQIPWHIWLPPLALWAGFFSVCYAAMVCLTSLLGRQWVVNERVDFPLLQVPLLMTQALDENRFARFMTSRYLVTGLLFCVCVHTLNSLHYYYPSVPELPTLFLAGSYFPKFGLFSGFYKLKLYIIPAFIGFAFFAPRSVSFSLWFFFLLAGIFSGILAAAGLQAPESALGVSFGPDLTRPEQAQTIGSFLVFALFIIYLARNHLKQTIQQGLRGILNKNTVSQDYQGASVWALWGFLLSFALIVVWCLWFGLSVAVAVCVPMVFFGMLLVAARLVCQAGLPFFTLTAAPVDAFTGLFGSGFFTHTGLIIVAIIQKMLFVDVRESALPTLFHGTKAAHRTPGPWLVTTGGGIILVLAVCTSFLVWLTLCYRYGLRDLSPGGADWATQSTLAVYENLQRLLDVPLEPNPWIIRFACLGAVVMFGLVACYSRLPWWPLHPIGYLAAYGTGMKLLWFSFFMGWLANHLCLHYGGTALFKKLRLLFAGFIIGDFLMAGLLLIAGIWTRGSYAVFPF